MRIIDGWHDVPAEARGGAIAIGNFDGVHRGHQELIAKAIAVAREKKIPAGAMIFEPHPREFFNPETAHFRLTPVAKKLDIFERLGLDFATVIPFDAELADLQHFDFTDKVLVAAFKVRHVVVGYDFYYGRARRGSPETMSLAGYEHDFEVTVVEPVGAAGDVFSSTAIRLKLAQGDVEGAARDLGRNWSVAGKVVGGAQRGMGLGYPTANLPMPKGTALGHGIYAVRTKVLPKAGDKSVLPEAGDKNALPEAGQKQDGKSHDAAAYLGTRPTFDDGMPVLEVFLLDFDGDLYGKSMEVEFIGFVRGDRKFDSSDDLVRQMDEDVARAREMLLASPLRGEDGPPRV